MTNVQIIAIEAERLAVEGLIQYTGRELTFETADGEEIVVKEAEDIHTFNGWKKRGFRVRKGERAIAKFPVWKHSGAKVEELPDGSGEYLDKGRMFMKTSCWFSSSQVEPIKA